MSLSSMCQKTSESAQLTRMTSSSPQKGLTGKRKLNEGCKTDAKTNEQVQQNPKKKKANKARLSLCFPSELLVRSKVANATRVQKMNDHKQRAENSKLMANMLKCSTFDQRSHTASVIYHDRCNITGLSGMAAAKPKNAIDNCLIRIHYEALITPKSLGKIYPHLTEEPFYRLVLAIYEIYIAFFTSQTTSKMAITELSTPDQLALLIAYVQLLPPPTSSNINPVFRNKSAELPNRKTRYYPNDFRKKWADQRKLFDDFLKVAGQSVLLSVDRQLMSAKQKQTLELMQWAYTQVNSRVIGNKSGKDDESALVPLIDLTNHISFNLANVIVTTGKKKSMVVKAIRDIKVGDEIVWDYGEDKANAYFYRFYRFTNNCLDPALQNIWHAEKNRDGTLNHFIQVKPEVHDLVHIPHQFASDCAEQFANEKHQASLTVNPELAENGFIEEFLKQKSALRCFAHQDLRVTSIQLVTQKKDCALCTAADKDYVQEGEDCVCYVWPEQLLQGKWRLRMTDVETITFILDEDFSAIKTKKPLTLEQLAASALKMPAGERRRLYLELHIFTISRFLIENFDVDADSASLSSIVSKVKKGRLGKCDDIPLQVVFFNQIMLLLLWRHILQTVLAADAPADGLPADLSAVFAQF